LHIPRPPPSALFPYTTLFRSRTWEGWLYLAVIMDAFSRRVVGWALADHLRTKLATDALQMALVSRRPGVGLIHHSDRGGQSLSRSEEHTSELQSLAYLVCRLL